MQINRTRPIMAFILVAVVCGFVIAAGLRASALTVVVSGRSPASFGASSGAVLGPVLRLREDGSTTIETVPLLSGDQGRSTTSRPVSDADTATGGQHTATVAVHHASATSKPTTAAGATVAKPVVPATPPTPTPTTSTPRPGSGGTSSPTVAKPTTGSGSGSDVTPGTDGRGRHGHGHGGGQGKGHGADKARARDQVATPSSSPAASGSDDSRGNGNGKGPEKGQDKAQNKADQGKGHGNGHGHGKGNARHRHR